jgi:hypothetical protein
MYIPEREFPGTFRPKFKSSVDKNMSITVLTFRSLQFNSVFDVSVHVGFEAFSRKTNKIKNYDFRG